MRVAFIAAKEIVVKGVDTIFDLVADDLDKELISEIRDLARKLLKKADEEEARLLG